MGKKARRQSKGSRSQGVSPAHKPLSSKEKKRQRSEAEDEPQGRAPRVKRARGRNDSVWDDLMDEQLWGEVWAKRDKQTRASRVNLNSYREQDSNDYTEDYILEANSFFDERPSEFEGSEPCEGFDDSDSLSANQVCSAAEDDYAGDETICITESAEPHDDDHEAYLKRFFSFFNEYEEASSSAPSSRSPSPTPSASRYTYEVLRRWCRPGPSPLFQDHITDQPAPNLRHIFDLLKVRYEGDEDETGYPLPLRHLPPHMSPSHGGLSQYAPRISQRIIPIKRDHSIRDSGYSLSTELPRRLACDWLCSLPSDIDALDCSELVQEFLQRRVTQFLDRGMPRLKDNDPGPMERFGTPHTKDWKPLYTRDGPYSYRLVFDDNFDINIDALWEDSDAGTSDGKDSSNGSKSSLGNMLLVTFSRVIGGEDEEDNKVGVEVGEGVETTKLWVYPDEKAVEFWKKHRRVYKSK
ncbi:hypothetical protein C8Q78DRAFT_1156070 [Trametes maxima]|nr:hypothetical protein C8Q78DRAFT_1156070 [Trametes maxima]